MPHSKRANPRPDPPQVPVFHAPPVEERPLQTHGPASAVQILFSGKYGENIQRNWIKSLSFGSPARKACATMSAPAEMEMQIVERERAQQALRVEEMRTHLAAIVESSEDAIVSKTLDGIISSWNPGAERVFGYSAKEVIGMPMALLIPPDRNNEEPEILRRISRGERVQDFETLRIRKDRSQVAVSITISPIRDEQGNIVGASKIARDITERRRAKERLKASFKDLNDFNAALDEHAIVGTTDPNDVLTYLNDKFCAVSKYSREELLGQDYRMVNSGYHSKEFFRSLWSTITEGRVWKGEIRNRAKDGACYWVDTTIVPLLGPDGKPYQYVTIRTDTTARKLAEEELRETHERLRRLLSHSPAVIFNLKIEGRAFVPVFVSENIEKLLGFTPVEAGRYEWWLENVHPEDRDRVLAALGEGMTGAGCAIEYRSRHKDGAYV